jgi:hypothetical protein
MSDKLDRANSHNLMKLNEYIHLRFEEHLDDREIAKRMKKSLRQIYRYNQQIPEVIFSDEYKMKLTMKFFSIWARRIRDAENDYNNNISQFDPKTGKEVIDRQARAQFSKVLNDTLREADRFLSKTSLLDSDKSVIEHKLSYKPDDVKESIFKIISEE